MTTVHLSVRGALDGANPGAVFASAKDAQTALLLSPEGIYLAGRADDASVNAALRQRIADTMTALQGDVALIADGEEWRTVMPIVCPVPPREVARRFYRFEGTAPLCETPDGFALRRVDTALMDDAKLRLSEHMIEWATTNWGSVAEFVRRGFGFCAVETATGEAASWSLADVVAEGRCEIGIQTAEPYRRRGLAAAVTAAMVRYALTEAKLSAVGWHCSVANVGSSRTAERVGFRHVADYTQFVCHYGNAL